MAALLSSAWNTVLAGIEAQLMKELELVIHECSTGRVCMPSYDGLLVRHSGGDFSFADVVAAWREHSLAKYKFYLPIVAKDWAKEVPLW